MASVIAPVVIDVAIIVSAGFSVSLQIVASVTSTCSTYQIVKDKVKVNIKVTIR